MAFDGSLFGAVFVTLVVIMDPFGNVPLFLGLTRRRTAREQRILALQGVLVSLGVIASFALLGQQVLNYLGIGIPALQGAGGLLLTIVALELLTDKREEADEVDNVNVALVPLGTPLLAGPGAIVATIVFVQQHHTLGQRLAIGAGILAVHVVLFLSLFFSVLITRVLRDAGIELLTRIAGLLLSAIALQLIAQSVTGFVRAAG